MARMLVYLLINTACLSLCVLHLSTYGRCVMALRSLLPYPGIPLEGPRFTNATYTLENKYSLVEQSSSQSNISQSNATNFILACVILKFYQESLSYP